MVTYWICQTSEVIRQADMASSGIHRFTAPSHLLVCLCIPPSAHTPPHTLLMAPHGPVSGTEQWYVRGPPGVSPFIMLSDDYGIYSSNRRCCITFTQGLGLSAITPLASLWEGEDGGGQGGKVCTDQAHHYYPTTESIHVILPKFTYPQWTQQSAGRTGSSGTHQPHF